jgi:hypothetical protein
MWAEARMVEDHTSRNKPHHYYGTMMGRKNYCLEGRTVYKTTPGEKYTLKK